MTQETKDALLKIVEFIAKNQQKESSFAYPNPQFYMFRDPLLDFIVEEIKLSSKEVEGVFVKVYP